MKNVHIPNGGKVCRNGSPQAARGEGLARTDVGVKTESGGEGRGRVRKINAPRLQ